MPLESCTLCSTNSVTAGSSICTVNAILVHIHHSVKSAHGCPGRRPLLIGVCADAVRDQRPTIPHRGSRDGLYGHPKRYKRVVNHNIEPLARLRLARTSPCRYSSTSYVSATANGSKAKHIDKWQVAVLTSGVETRGKRPPSSYSVGIGIGSVYRRDVD
jgi:hypothetical protein